MISSASSSVDEDDNAPAPPPTKNAKKAASKDKAATKVKNVGDSYTSEMTVEERTTAFGLLSGNWLLRYADKMQVPITARVRKGKSTPGHLAKSAIWVPLLAIDLWQKRGVPLKEKSIIGRWRQSERPPSSEPMPTKDAMTREQKCESLKCVLKEVLAKEATKLNQRF